MQTIPTEAPDSTNLDGSPVRSISVSEMVRSYSETKLGPTVPPKPRYSLLPASHAQSSPDPVLPNRQVKPISSSPVEKVLKKAGFSVVNSPLLPGPTPSPPIKKVGFIVDEKPRSIPVHVDNYSRKEETLSHSSQPLRADHRLDPVSMKRDLQPQKTSPVFRTGVHGFLLGGSNSKPNVISELEEPVVPDFNEQPEDFKSPFHEKKPFLRSESSASKTAMDELDDTKVR